MRNLINPNSTVRRAIKIWNDWANLDNVDLDLNEKPVKINGSIGTIYYSRLVSKESGRVLTDAIDYNNKNILLKLYINNDIKDGFFQLNIFEHGDEWYYITSYTDNKFTLKDSIDIEDFLDTLESFYNFSKEGVFH